MDKSSSRDNSSSSDSSSLSESISSSGISSSSSAIGSDFALDFFLLFGDSSINSSEALVVTFRLLKIRANIINNNAAGKVDIKTVNHELEKTLSFSRSACCFSNNNSCSLACALANKACCNLIISSICNLISLLLATSFCIVPNWLLNDDKR